MAMLVTLLMAPLPLAAQDNSGTVSSTIGQLPQVAIGQEYQLSQDPDNPDSPPQFQPVPNGDSDDSNVNSDDDDNSSDDNASSGDNDQNQNDDNQDNSDNAAPSDDNAAPQPPGN
ncbi:MAG TPA: hypothetical protein VMF50_10320 [Candidatus Binataceae bacterium]|nr:hypothetical protein [Candidatus Binataceae bacterium]